MGLRLSMLLNDVGVSLRDVRLLRHQEVGPKGITPYSLWRDNRAQFDLYQSFQSSNRRAYFRAKHWCSFVRPANGGTLFVGLYDVELLGSAPSDLIDPVQQKSLRTYPACDLYRVSLSPALSEYVGRLWVEWGPGTKSWVQRADASTGDKPIIELTAAFQEPEFPGFAEFIKQLSQLPSLPSTWIATLSSARGVYLLTCPRTREQYVGSARGADGFWGRWEAYVAGGHGGNVGLKSRDPSNYQVSILEVAGSAATEEDILVMEARWKSKLQSREMGLNRN